MRDYGEKTMKILAHRGLWTTVSEKNSMEAFVKAFEHGYGIETDVRDYMEKLVVSHNVATSECFLFEDVLRAYREAKSDMPLAINIKADGIQDLIRADLDKFDIKNYFVFDMSIPEQVVYHKQEFNAFTRMSEYEKEPVLLEKSQGVWMDEWENSWISERVIDQMRQQGKKVSIISPEIHGRDKANMWKFLKKYVDDADVMLCTDTPVEAEEYFYGN